MSKVGSEYRLLQSNKPGGPVQHFFVSQALFLLSPEQQVALDLVLQRDGGQVTRIQPPNESAMHPHGWVEVDGDRIYDWYEESEEWRLPEGWLL